MEKLDYSIKEKYCDELREIKFRLDRLKDGKIYELSNTKSDGFLKANIDKLYFEIAELLFKIQNGRKGEDSEISEWFGLNT